MCETDNDALVDQFTAGVLCLRLRAPLSILKFENGRVEPTIC